jgi:uncharacterized protein YndB with AHSA1/START domain
MTASGNSDAHREIVVSRMIDAPRELVFDAFTDPTHIVEWWGPDGFTTTTERMDVRPGGDWRYVMHGPDGRDYVNRVNYLEISRPDRLVYQHAGDGDTEDIDFTTTITFVEAGGKTQLTMRATFSDQAGRDRVVEDYGAIEGGIQTLGRLAAYLANRRTT